MRKEGILLTCSQRIFTFESMRTHTVASSAFHGRYKAGIEKVGRMMKDQQRTTFVVVCIAESRRSTDRSIGSNRHRTLAHLHASSLNLHF